MRWNPADRLKIKALLLASTTIGSCLATPAAAQFMPVAQPPNHVSLDANEVDLVSGKFITSAVDASIGPQGPASIAIVRTITARGWTSNAMGQVSLFPSGAIASFGAHSTEFTYSGSTLVPTDGSGKKLVPLPGGTHWEYTLEDGTVVTFDTSPTDDVNGLNLGRAVFVKYPTGERLDFNYITQSVCSSFDDPCPDYVSGRRLQSITNNRGYQAKIDYQINTPTSASDIGTTWITPVKATLFNRAVDACDPFASTCSFSQA